MISQNLRQAETPQAPAGRPTPAGLPAAPRDPEIQAFEAGVDAMYKLEALWKAYQTGQGNADLTDKQVFFHVLKPLVDAFSSVAEGPAKPEQSPVTHASPLTPSNTLKE